MVPSSPTTPADAQPQAPGQNAEAQKIRAQSTAGPAAKLVHLPDLAGVRCPCGVARRAFADDPEFPGTVHLTEIHTDARCHYHQSHTEVYVVLECDDDAAMELDGKLVPLRPHTSVLIPPGVRHRALGKMKVLIVCTPEFDSGDEHFDD